MCAGGAGKGKVGVTEWTRHHVFGVDTSEACHPVRPSPVQSGSVQVTKNALKSDRNTKHETPRREPDSSNKRMLVI